MADVSGIGDVIAGGIGGIANIGFGIYDRQQQREQERAARRRVKQVTDQTASDYNQMVNMLDKWRKDQINTATPEMVSEYSRLLSSFDPSEYTADIEKFKFTDESGKPLTREDFLATNRDQILQSVTDRIQHSAAGAGLGRGTGAALGIAEGVAAKDEELQKMANEQYLGERQQAYSEWSNYIDKMQRKLDAERAGTESRISMLGGAIGQQQQQESDYMADLLSLLENKRATINQANLALV
jgi:hypothetical protein